MKKPPHIALLIAATTKHGRGVLSGVAEYIRVHELWVCEYDAWYNQGHIPRVIAQCDGIIGTIVNDSMARKIAALNIPTVNIYSAGFVHPPFAQIFCNDEMIGQLAGRELALRGFNHFAYCVANRTQFYTDQYHGFVTALHRANIPDVSIHLHKKKITKTQSRSQELADWLPTLPKPVAIFACSDSTGRAILETCRDIHIPVPDEVAVIGVDNDEQLCGLTYPPLSSVALASEKLGYEAASLLDQMMKGQKPPKYPIRIPPLEVVVRQSSDILAIDDPDLREALRIIRQQATRGLSVPDILDAIPISRRTLERRFLIHLKRTPADEIRRIRIDRARILLSETTLPMPEIAERCGFSTPARFSIVFRQTASMTPGQYRQQFRTR